MEKRMDNTRSKPSVIITDFDRTIAYLYRDTSLLTKLNQAIVSFYQNHIEIPSTIINRNEDGYFVWHKLHDFVEQTLSDVADPINKKAEDLVTQFEIEVIKQVGMLDGIKEVCLELRKLGIRLAIVSNNAEKAIRFALKMIGIEQLFDYIGGRPYPFNPSMIKPNSYPIDQAIKTLGVSKSDLIWYTGDDVMDMIAAKRAGVLPVGVYYGRHSEADLIRAGASLTFSSFLEILPYILSLDA